ncbi:hypothetical protein HPB51_010021 [Rhipicephalus microplus]|uniref:Uncharacterized protein n=1 Tax=Rhipicephalus microplus TaxID=6941 RepID=A0A9J6DTX3_RHIMP|nr:hypothetical protein HPB51_010021 [Rhipicephalus microplus]
MLRLFDVSVPRSADIISIIEAMNKLTPYTLAPAMTAPEPSIVRMLIRDFTEKAILPIPTGRLVLLFNEYLMRARCFPPYDVVEVENVGLLRCVVYISELGVETQQALTLSLGLRVAHELVWMAHSEIADVTLKIAGLPRSAHARRCLVDIENAYLTNHVSFLTIRVYASKRYAVTNCMVRMALVRADEECPRQGVPFVSRSHNERGEEVETLGGFAGSQNSPELLFLGGAGEVPEPVFLRPLR